MSQGKTAKYPKVLIVEDDPIISKSIKIQFEKINYVVKTVASVKEAWDCLSEFKPTAVVLDLLLPDKNGFEFLKEVRESEKWKTMPIIITTNLDTEEDIDKAYLLSAAEYLVKSDLTLVELVNKVTNHINLSTYSQKTLS
ncbi:MAG: response regulator [bacterium]|nr:response regulator [bacterium]